MIDPIKFLNEAIGEFKKLSWPSSRDTKRNSVLVIFVIAVTSIFLSLVDFVLQDLLITILNK